MTKSELMTGDIVEERSGQKLMVLKGTAHGDIIAGERGWNYLKNYDEDLSHTKQDICDYTPLDIVKVYRPKDNASFYESKLQYPDEMFSTKNLIWGQEKAFEVEIKVNGKTIQVSEETRRNIIKACC